MAVPQKIVLKSTTKISLNDRFTTIQKIAAERPPLPQQQQTVTAMIRDEVREQRQASVRNRRLAQQMANRPTVQAALRLKKRSLNVKQRLGKSNIKARLTLRGGPGGLRGGRGGLRGAGKSRGTQNYSIRARRGGTGIGRGPRGRGQLRGQSRGNRARLRGTQNYSIRARGNRGARGSPRGSSRGRGGGTFRGQLRGGRGTGRGSPARGRGGQGRGRGGNSPRFSMRGRGRGRGGRGRGRGRGQKPPSREDLDNELDAYMANTKSSLDKDIDNYMSTVDE